MFACRAAWQRCGPLARRAAFRLPRDGLLQRQMSSMPGGSGENIVYTVLCGGVLVGAVSYAFNTVSTDSARFNDRISEIKTRPKKEWTPKPWPPKRGEAGPAEEASEEAAAEAAADSESETVVEAVEEIVVEGAEVVIEMAEEVVPAAQQAEVMADEAVQVAEVVEETAHTITEQVATEDPESNVVLAASPMLEGTEVEEQVVCAAAVNEAAVKDALLPPGVMESVETALAMLDEEAAPSPVEAAWAVEEASRQTEALVGEEVQPTIEPAPLVEIVVTPAPVVVDAPTLLEVAPAVGEAPIHSEVTPAAEKSTTLGDFTLAVEEASTPVEVVPEVEEAPIHLEVAPAVEDSITPGDFTLAVEEASTSIEVVPPVEESQVALASVVEEVLTPVVVEEALPFVEAAPVVEETPTPVPMTQTVEEEPILMDVPVVEEALTTVECFPATEDSLPSTVPAPVVEEVPDTVEIAPVIDEALPPFDSTPAIEKTTLVVQVQASPVIEETTLPLKFETTVEEILSTEEPNIDLASSIEEEAPPPLVEALEKDSKREYIVVVLEGTPKEDKSPKVLGVAPMAGRIIPAPEDEDKRHLHRVQMQ
ncbi:calphotin isoform X1 [Phyllopteryx taeniolatus]|uniref:calphotin isoform X1 n=1 Tax=Phyllopteryx taeniolatus TaxID=161469 RepID=UPI002AD438C8|nr:calphotin isoform X1 [Phyllopteryx taeniolatus]XP_061643219.1 calphotin isoform X1 [Phyllopteryx taeniolatus]